MKSIEVEYTIEIEAVIEYWQKKLDALWNKRKKMDKEIEMIDNTLSYLKALKTVMSQQIEIVIQNESQKAN